MKKCGLRKAYAMGGELGEMDPTELAQFTNNPEVLNAASTRKWTMEEAAQQAKYPGRAFIDPVTKQDIGRAHRGLGMALQESGMVAPPQPQAQQPALQSPQLPMETTFQQDIDARQQRMAGYRAKLGYAGGGTIDPDALMREMAAKYGTSGAQPQVAAPAPQPAPAPVQAPQPKPTLLDGLRRLATGNLEGRMKAAGFKQGGTVDGKGYIHGEKGVDKVPAKIAETGEDILVSHGERIVNKKQNAALERLAAEAGMSLDEYLMHSTGEPVGPQMKQGLRGLNKGGFVDDFGNLQEPTKFQGGANRTVLHQQIANAAADAQAAPTGQTVSRMPSQPAPAAQAPVASPAAPAQAAGRFGKLASGLRSVVTSPYLLAPAILQAGASAIDAIDSIPSLRGQHTAASTDMSIPESERVVAEQKDLAARDAAWAVRHNKPVAPAKNVTTPSIDPRTPAEQAAAGAQAGLEVKGLRNAMQFLGGEGAAVPEGMRFSSQTESNAPLSTWNSKQDVAAQSINNRITPENGTGIMSVKQKDGTFKNVAIGQSEYTGADGKPTSDWSKTQQYADGVAQAQKTKDSLARIKRERAEFAAFDPSITDPVARDAGLRAVSKYMVEDQLAQKAASDKAKLGLEVAKFNQEERKINNLQSNSERDHRYKVETDDDKRLDDVLKSRATVDGKLDGKKYADYQRFVGNFKAKNAGENGKHRAKDILDAMELWEAYGEDDGSIFRRVSGQGSDMPTGLDKSPGLLWGENYVDPRTGRQISSTRVSEMSPGARAIFEQNRKN